jgi:preprotein translocase subunit YajC
MNLAFILLMGQPASSTGGQSNALITFIPLLLVFVVFYFFMIRPQMKKQKEMNSYRSSLKKGDKVVTTGGIYGRVYEIKDNYVLMDAGGDVRLKIDKNALLKDPTADEQS